MRLIRILNFFSSSSSISLALNPNLPMTSIVNIDANFHSKTFHIKYCYRISSFFDITNFFFYWEIKPNARLDFIFQKNTNSGRFGLNKYVAIKKKPYQCLCVWLLYIYHRVNRKKKLLTSLIVLHTNLKIKIPARA